jgi:hypothetical protein
MTDATSLRRIRSVEARSGYRVVVAWDTGRPLIIDLSDMISRGGVFAALSDHSKFSAVRVGDSQRVIEWPEPMDDLGDPVVEIDAEALFEKANDQRRNALASIAQLALEDSKKKPRATLSRQS